MYSRGSSQMHRTKLGDSNTAELAAYEAGGLAICQDEPVARHAPGPANDATRDRFTLRFLWHAPGCVPDMCRHAGWQCSDGCPIELRLRNNAHAQGGAAAVDDAIFGSRAAGLRHSLLLRPAGRETIAILHIRHTVADPAAAAGRRRRLTVLFSKGNSFDLGQLRYHMVQLAVLLGVDVLGYDYAGYGASSGSPSVTQTAVDVAAAAAAAKELGIPTELTVLYGFSLGNGPALELAAAAGGQRWAGVLLRSPFASGAAVATEMAARHPAAPSWAPVGRLPWFMDGQLLAATLSLSCVEANLITTHSFLC